MDLRGIILRVPLKIINNGLLFVIEMLVRILTLIRTCPTALLLESILQSHLLVRLFIEFNQCLTQLHVMLL